MKSKFLALSLILASSFTTVNAQEAQKKSDNIYIGAGIGAMSVLNDGVNSPTFNINVKLGKYITPVWGVRAEIAGAWQTLDKQNTGYSKDNKTFGEINLDATMSLTNLFLKYDENRALDLYVFGGPTMNISSAVNGTYTTDLDINITYPDINQSESDQTIMGSTNKTETGIYSFETEGAKARFGATVGLGLDYNFNNKWAMNIEGRFGVTPSIFGFGSDCRKAEATARVTLGVKHTFGGKNFCKAETKIVEKVVEKEVIKEVPVEVVKEVIKEVSGSGAAAIFFKISKSQISPEGMVNVKLMAKVIKQTPNTKYKVAGFADKATGTPAINQTLSEKRAQAVYDALVAEGVNPSQLEKVAMGGTDPMFEKAYLNRVVILEVK